MARTKRKNSNPMGRMDRFVFSQHNHHNTSNTHPKQPKTKTKKKRGSPVVVNAPGVGVASNHHNHHNNNNNHNNHNNTHNNNNNDYHNNNQKPRKRKRSNGIDPSKEQPTTSSSHHPIPTPKTHHRKPFGTKFLPSRTPTNHGNHHHHPARPPPPLGVPMGNHPTTTTRDAECERWNDVIGAGGELHTTSSFQPPPTPPTPHTAYTPVSSSSSSSLPSKGGKRTKRKLKRSTFSFKKTKPPNKHPPKSNTTPTHKHKKRRLELKSQSKRLLPNSSGRLLRSNKLGEDVPWILTTTSTTNTHNHYHHHHHPTHATTTTTTTNHNHHNHNVSVTPPLPSPLTNLNNRILPVFYQSVHPRTILRFRSELVSFANYVRLTPAEVKARKYLVEVVTNLSREIFSTSNRGSGSGGGGSGGGRKTNGWMGKLPWGGGGGGGKGVAMKRKRRLWGVPEPSESPLLPPRDDGVVGNTDGSGMGRSSRRSDDPEETIHVSTFGSFSELNVCGFTSDVDMALWGVVDLGTNVVEEWKTHDDEDDEDDDDGGDEEGEEGDDNHGKIQKQWKKQRIHTESGRKHIQWCDDMDGGGVDGEDESVDGESGRNAQQELHLKRLAKEAKIARWRETLRLGEELLQQKQQQQQEEEEEEILKEEKKEEDEATKKLNGTSRENETTTERTITKENDFSNALFCIDRTRAPCLLEPETETETVENNAIPAVDKGAETNDAQDENEDDREDDENEENDDDADKMENFRKRAKKREEEQQEEEENQQEEKKEEEEQTIKKNESSSEAVDDEQTIKLKNSEDNEFFDDLFPDAKAKTLGYETIVVDKDASDVDTDGREEDDEEDIENKEEKGSTDKTHFRKRSRDDRIDERNTIDLCYSSSTEEECDHDEEESNTIELNLSSSTTTTDFGSSPSYTTTQKAKLSRKQRTAIVDSLYRLKRKLHRDTSVAHKIECRARARVPIVCITTRYGFESDISLGGQSGADTSDYVSSQVERYSSFATVVLFLKILLEQVKLDKPFTGGIGSYKLYVMLAYHFEKHLALGGDDNPEEILLSFFFRYGNTELTDTNTDTRPHPEARTRIDTQSILRSHGGEADLSSAYRIDECVAVFGLCFERLMERLSEASYEKESSSNNCLGENPSFLKSIIDAQKLEMARQKCLKAVETFKEDGNKNRTLAPNFRRYSS